MSVKKNSEHYFLQNRPRVQIDFAEQKGDPGLTMLREAQAGAYWAARSHFTAWDNPALIVMPTGSGKTAVMTLLAFGLVRKRLLIIAPSRVIIEQVAREFQTLKIARETGCLPDDLEAPKVHVVQHKIGSKKAWMELSDFDVVVSSANCASPDYKDVYSKPPKDLFDTLFFDEAHHWPASTWDSLSRSFPGLRIVGFTATPYRNDKKPVPGEIVYSYPLSRAIERGIYREVEFIPVKGYGSKEQRGRHLAERAQQIWEEENKHRQAKLLVRVGKLKETRPIRELYADLDLDLEVVSSDHSLKRNEAAIKRAKEDDQCAGLIAVGMLGEGLDLPILQIAVMHKPYQSFPITLQFVGRICRMSGEQEGTAKLLAIPDEVEEHTRGLYELDANWAELIPALADAAVGTERDRRRFARERWSILTQTKQVSIHTLKPSFSVAVFQVIEQELDITRRPKLSRGIELFQSFISDDKKWRVLITRTAAKPIWTTSDSLHNVDYNLLIYYRVGDLLFESTTSPGIALQVRKSLKGKAKLKLVDEERIEQAISQGSVLAYYNVGMRKVAYASDSIPTYKMMAGGHAEAAIREADGDFFSVGHLFGKVKWNGGDIVLGISGDSAKIWAAARDHLREFTLWCDQLAARLTNDLSVPLPYVSHLRSAELVDTLPAQPYMAEFRESFYRHLQEGLCLDIEFETDEIRRAGGSDRFELEVIRSSWQQAKPHRCNLKLTVRDAEFTIRYNAQDQECFCCEPKAPCVGCLVKVPERGRFQDYSLGDYFNQFPPTLFLADGSAIVGRYLYLYEPPEYNVPEELFLPIDWDSLACAITVEDINMVKEKRRKQLEAKGKCSVLDATAKILPGLFATGTFIFNDHHAGEIADYVALEPERDILRVHLIHCKASEKATPGARQTDAYEVLGQARKCARWLRRPELFEAMGKRLEEEKVVQGTRKDFDRLTARCFPQTAEYTVHLVQPGFNIEKIQEWSDPSIRLMFLSLYDELRHDNSIDLHIIGSLGNR